MPVADREREFYDRHWARIDPAAGHIEGTLDIPGVTLSGKRILICSCGSGVEVVQAARAGASVHAFDLSSVAVENARRAGLHHGYDVDARVMDFHALQYPDDFFDVAYGSCILHHVGCEAAGKELFRVLKPGGIAVFWENSDRNPVLRWARRVLFGVPGAYQRQQRWFFRRAGTTDEYPLTDEEVGCLARIFDGRVVITREWFCFFEVLDPLLGRPAVLCRITRALDEWLVKALPSVRSYSFYQTVRLEKPVVCRTLSAGTDVAQTWVAGQRATQEMP